LLGLPMSRRERLALNSKEKARTERRARARVRWANLEELDAKLGRGKEGGQGRSRDGEFPVWI